MPIILVILVIVVSIVILVSIARALFFSGGATDTVAEADTTQQALVSTSLNRSVEMSVRGPIVAEEEFRSYRITVSPNERTIRSYKGYTKTVIESRTLGNNIAAYDEFVNALDLANMTKGTQSDGDYNVQGICATGKVYEFRLLKDGEPIETLWTSTCRGSSGTLEASADQLSTLFIRQIPDAKDVIRNLSL
ncbi:hypothetical protein GW930_02905 [Candidatus Saccharibacteria bacterium]|nr:hypothetical protein [Candidatus Saccharibacteria bacterium]